MTRRLLGFGPFYDFEDVIADVDDADRIDLRTDGESGFWVRTSQRANSALRLATGGALGNRGPLPGAEIAALSRDYDLTLLVCTNLFDVRLLSLIRRLRERSRKVVVYAPEQWPIDFDHYRFRQMPYGMVDHVFLGFADPVAAVAEASGCDASELALGLDTLKFVPSRDWDDRAYDVCWIGRRTKPMHEDLMRGVAEQRWRYYFDTFSVGTFDSLQEHRKWLATLLGDSRFSICHYARATQPELTHGQRQLAGRFLESAAAGCVLVGAPPTVPQFETVMPWEDACFPTALDEDRVDRLIARLAADPARMRAASRRNVAGMLRTNDWAYRWSQVLDTVGLARSPRLAARLDRLAAEATRWEEPGAPAAGRTP